MPLATISWNVTIVVVVVVFVAVATIDDYNDEYIADVYSCEILFIPNQHLAEFDVHFIN